MPENIEVRLMTKNMPDLKIGDVVEVRPYRELRAEHYEGLVDCGWNEAMNYLCGRRFVITAEMYDRYVFDRQNWIVEIDGYFISPSMLRLVGDEPEEEEESNSDNGYSLRNYSQDSSILEEMIGKVDRIRFKKLLCIASCDKSITMKTISDDIVNKYLVRWAKAKYDLYLLFGRKLSLSKQIETAIDYDTMVNKIVELQFAFPQYANLLGGFSPEEFINNKCSGYNRLLSRVYDKYTDGAKLSKVLTGLVDDKEFGDALAMLFGKTTVNAMLTLSIDPFDYLTMSINKHGWETCQRIGDPDAPFGTGAGSLMIDEYTVIAFAHSGKDVMYHINSMEFSGNSKFWRQCLYVDKDSGNFVASREYPSEKELIAKEARILLEDTIADYLEIENQWVVRSRGEIDYVEGSDNLFHDVSNDYLYRDVRIKDSKAKTHVKVGRNVFCMKCGKVITGHRGRYVCDNDFSYESDDDDELEIPF